MINGIISNIHTKKGYVYIFKELLNGKFMFGTVKKIYAIACKNYPLLKKVSTRKTTKFNILSLELNNKKQTWQQESIHVFMCFTTPCLVNLPDFIPPLKVTLSFWSRCVQVGNLTVSMTFAVWSLLLTIKYWKTRKLEIMSLKMHKIFENNRAKTSFFEKN